MIDEIDDMAPAAAMVALRNAYGMTRREFCEHFDITPRTLQNWEYGERTPTQFVLTSIRKCYELEQENKQMHEYIALLNRQNEELKNAALGFVSNPISASEHVGVDAFGSYDDVREFCREVFPRVAWDLLPWRFLHELYMAWAQKRSGKFCNIGKTKFMSLVRRVVMDEFPEWVENQVFVTHRMDAYEPLIFEYGLTNWMNKNRTGQKTDWEKRYRGLVRDPSVAAALAADAASGTGVTPDGNE